MGPGLPGCSVCGHAGKRAGRPRRAARLSCHGRRRLAGSRLDRLSPPFLRAAAVSQHHCCLRRADARVYWHRHSGSRGTPRRCGRQSDVRHAFLVSRGELVYGDRRWRRSLRAAHLPLQFQGTAAPGVARGALLESDPRRSLPGRHLLRDPVLTIPTHRSFHPAHCRRISGRRVRCRVDVRAGGVIGRRSVVRGRSPVGIGRAPDGDGRARGAALCGTRRYYAFTDHHGVGR